MDNPALKVKSIQTPKGGPPNPLASTEGRNLHSRPALRYAQVRGIQKYLVFVLFVLFPLGQLIRIPINSLISIHPLDVLVATVGLFFLLSNKIHLPPFAKITFATLLVTQALSLRLFSPSQTIIGWFYLLRLCSYMLFAIAFRNLLSKKIISTSLVAKLLLISGCTSALITLAQYILFPDLRPLQLLGWDDHLYRAVGGFLDPTFAGIIAVLTMLLLLSRFLGKLIPPKLFAPLAFINLSALLLTYSRSSYLALLGGLAVAAYYSSKKLKIILLTISFLAIIPLLPRPSSEGVKLERTSSIMAHQSNYTLALQIIGNQPFLGIGYNNLCIAKQKFGLYRPSQFSQDHACSGLDNSLLVILTSTGLLGTVVIVLSLTKGFKNLTKSPLVASAIAAIAIHSMFSNTLFYPWVMFWLGVILSLTHKPTKEHS